MNYLVWCFKSSCIFYILFQTPYLLARQHRKIQQNNSSFFQHRFTEFSDYIKMHVLTDALT